MHRQRWQVAESNALIIGVGCLLMGVGMIAVALMQPSGPGLATSVGTFLALGVMVALSGIGLLAWFEVLAQRDKHHHGTA